MRTKASLRKLVTGCSKHCFEVVDETDEEIFEEYEKGARHVDFSFVK
ncbi:hypothetical protein [Streptococcus pneumoniae]|nr:hypothetical protein [Streptococcus pneumoniae]